MAVIRLYLMRHGPCDESASDSLSPDGRPLSEKGRRRVRRAASAFRRLGEDVDRVWTSPAIAAVQTAERLSCALRVDRLALLDDLRRTSSGATLLQRIRKEAKEGEGVVLVGHQGVLCELIGRVLEMPRTRVLALKLPRCAILRLDLDGESAKPGWTLSPSGDIGRGLPG